MLLPPDSLAVLALALFIEAIKGYPDALYRRMGHPVTWIGALIAWADRALNREDASFASRRAAGIVALVLILAAAALPAFAAEAILQALGWFVAFIGLAILASSLLAQRSLRDHVGRVAVGLERGGLEGGRAAVSHIVGRNPATLDEAGVCRAAIESLAENFSDGVVAPAFWLGAGGLTGGVLYKAINTADSMIGHRTPRHEAFGWAAARLDDLVNLPASRLSALLIVAAAAASPDASAREAIRAVGRDAGKHRSPNAGWPEAAMAGALGLRLAGPRVYGDVRVEDAWMGEGRADAGPKDIRRALKLYARACTFLWCLAAALAVIAAFALG